VPGGVPTAKARVLYYGGAGHDLVEVKRYLELRRVLGRWTRCDVMAIDEAGHVKGVAAVGKAGLRNELYCARWTGDARVWVDRRVPLTSPSQTLFSIDESN